MPKYSFTKEAKESVGLVGALWFWVFIGFVTLSALTAGALYLKPTFLGLERKAFVASHQYIEARRSELTELDSEVRKINIQIAASSDEVKGLLQTQRSALVERMRQAASKIPTDAVPDAVRRTLDGG